MHVRPWSYPGPRQPRTPAYFKTARSLLQLWPTTNVPPHSSLAHGSSKSPYPLVAFSSPRLLLMITRSVSNASSWFAKQSPMLEPSTL
ncbi:uncharacterized protein K452DRAFT_8600 [Aplosporella prunicola CBS 121167]|uniref:Uncharacterized protein n=1 Tax=Aplosporella prunicola CBS 121167 TaxID=1176127 RepID=A0A6A6BU46_9PEZI|nr:uncharacterized protein K452DRAFT_8600 [Aplosporella prunicola CBS 121167]KAF2147530.1 hypothetical protein K452DRAFT_8600 [Aplosporella prunicola CBS 121167]